MTNRCSCRQLAAARSDESVVAGAEGRKKTELHLMNLNEDPLLSGVVVHFLQKGDTTVGRKDAEPVPSVCLSGLRQDTCKLFFLFSFAMYLLG